MAWTDTELYRRGCATLVASWAEYARACEAAAVRRLPGVEVAVFPRDPERAVYNNALLRRDAPAAAALDGLEAAYEAAGVRHFAAWVHDSDEAARVALLARGYTLDTTTRAMGMPLRNLPVPDPDVEVEPVDWPEYLAMAGLPPDFLRRWASAISAGSWSSHLRPVDRGQTREVSPGPATATLLRPPRH